MARAAALAGGLVALAVLGVGVLIVAIPAPGQPSLLQGIFSTGTSSEDSHRLQVLAQDPALSHPPPGATRRIYLVSPPHEVEFCGHPTTDGYVYADYGRVAGDPQKAISWYSTVLPRLGWTIRGGDCSRALVYLAWTKPEHGFVA